MSFAYINMIHSKEKYGSKTKDPQVCLSFWFCDYIIIHHHVCHHCLIPLCFSTSLFILNHFAVCTWSIHEALFYRTHCHKQLSFKKVWVSISKLKKGSLVFTCHFLRSSDQLFQLEKEKGYTHVLIWWVSVYEVGTVPHYIVLFQRVLECKDWCFWLLTLFCTQAVLDPL